MKKLETREVRVVYCDVCGAECNNYTTFNPGTPDEKDACSRPCELKISDDIVKVAMAKRNAGVNHLPGSTGAGGNSDGA